MSVFYFSLFLIIVSVIKCAEIISTIVISRHGDRTSEFFKFKGDAKVWPKGVGEMTQMGKERIYNLGLYIREKYIIKNTLLSRQYIPSEIYVRSSDVDRTIETAYIVGLALYPIETHSNDSASKIHVPVPTHIVPSYQDLLINIPQSCSKIMFNELYVKKKNELDIKYEKLYDLIGKKLSTKISTANMWEYADNFKCKIECNLALPLWANNKYKETTIEKEMEAARLESFIHLFTNEYIAMHAGGNFVHNIVQVFDIFLKKSTIKMTYYSAHDVTLMYLMSVLGIYEEPPHYGSLLMIDLIKGSEKQDDQEIYIKFYFRDTNLYKPQVRQLYVKGCDEPCSYSKFRVYVIENISNNLKEICQTRRLGHVDSKTMYNLLWFIISFGLFIAAIIILGIAVFKLRKRKYVNIDTESNDAS